MARPGSLMAAGQVQGGARRPNTLLLVDDERRAPEQIEDLDVIIDGQNRGGGSQRRAHGNPC